MVDFRRVLCPVDFSRHSERALRQAFAIARRYESALTVLHVEDVMLGAARAELHRRATLVDTSHDELLDFVHDVGGHEPGVDVRITAGDVVRGILDHAKHESSDLIVMGTRGRSGLARAILGSVTEGVVRQSACPVMTIPPASEMPSTTGEFEPYDPILCASDFSPSCRKALGLAISLGQETDARLSLIHGLQLPQVESGVMPMSFPMPIPIDFAEFRKDALARLERGLPDDAEFRCRPEAVVVEGHPADAILQIAQTENVKLIVMGVQARGTVDRLLFGSTTRLVMQAALCPVLSIRADQAALPWAVWPPPIHEQISVATASSSM